MQMNGGKLINITKMGSKRTGMRPLTNLWTDSFAFINANASCTALMIESVSSFSVSMALGELFGLLLMNGSIDCDE